MTHSEPAAMPASHRSIKRRVSRFVRFCTFALLPAASADAAFTGLGALSGDFSYSDAFAISADGSTVVGTSAVNADGDARSFKWTAADGMVALPVVLGDSPASLGYAVSADGSVISGMEIKAGGATIQAYIYQNGAVQFIPYLASSTFGSAVGLSADGSVAVGSASSGGNIIAFRWTQVGGTIGLPLLAGDVRSAASGISADGSVVVGVSSTNSSDRAFRWTEAGGTQALALPGNTSAANAISADGSTIVGEFMNTVTSTETAFVWREAGVVSLTSLSLDSLVMNRAYAVSGDGQWAVGTSDGQAVFWNTATGEVQNLKDFLIASGNTGLELWDLSAANGISSDGLTITGSGMNPAGDNEGWVAHLTVIPEPSALALAGLTVVALVTRRRKI